ncbi:hypothetical protein GOBAR_DD16261 [Gossypium barbadense]|nr:hypothetical protein GOBAR_DD16261 [Gossypium barbadense]
MAHHNRLPPLDSDWENWIFSNLDSKVWISNPQLPWYHVFSSALREIWLLRNAMIFNSNIKQGNVRLRALEGTMVVRWQPPGQGWKKLNTDSSLIVDSTIVISLISNVSISNAVLATPINDCSALRTFIPNTKIKYILEKETGVLTREQLPS